MGISAQDPYPAQKRSRFTVGRDGHGWWVVWDRKGLVGGLFKDRASAVHFAFVESDRVPGEVCCAPETETLNANVIFIATPATSQLKRIGH